MRGCFAAPHWLSEGVNDAINLAENNNNNGAANMLYLHVAVSGNQAEQSDDFADGNSSTGNPNSSRTRTSQYGVLDPKHIGKPLPGAYWICPGGITCCANGRIDGV